MKNSGQEYDANEIFQDAIVIFFKKAMEPDFAITHTANSYILGIAKNIFYKQFKTKMLHLKPENEFDIVEIEEHDDKDILDIVKKILNHTTETCRQVLIYWSQNYKMAEIASLMSYKSEMMARKKKHECIQKLSKFLKDNPKITLKIIGND
ncbi:MAG: sigma-70 family RNA polymerase sigma factor [Saprospiraceae bacterium]